MQRSLEEITASDRKIITPEESLIQIPGQGISRRVFLKQGGRLYIVNDANPETYTLNYPSTTGLPDTSKKCPASYSQWKGEGDQTYFEDKCA